MQQAKSAAGGSYFKQIFLEKTVCSCSGYKIVDCAFYPMTYYVGIHKFEKRNWKINKDNVKKLTAEDNSDFQCFEF